MAIPALADRGLTGTFYINPGAAWFLEREKEWTHEVPATGMEYGNHTRVRERLWIATHTQAHKYATERDASRVEIVRADAREIRVSLHTDADPVLYDHPLTLVTTLPDEWTACTGHQAGRSLAMDCSGNRATYSVEPGIGEIVLTRL